MNKEELIKDILSIEPAWHITVLKEFNMNRLYVILEMGELKKELKFKIEEDIYSPNFVERCEDLDDEYTEKLNRLIEKL